MKTKSYIKIISLIIIVIIAFAIGYCSKTVTSENSNTTVSPITEKQKQIWTCSMHPQIRKNEPGQCPICGMDLIPVETTSEGGRAAKNIIKLSPDSIKLAEIQTAPVEEIIAEKELRLTGKIVFDETRVADISAWTPGRLEKMFVNYVGVKVTKGEHLFYLYSEELYVKQAEYVIARQAGRTPEGSGRESLILAGMSEKQVEELEKTGKPQLYVTIYSPLSGTVVERHGNEGMYVNKGTLIYKIADLSKLWLLLDVYESDVGWLRYGQKVLFNVESIPGITLTGKIVFIPPVLDEKTRTIKVRVNVDNSAGKLKPGLLAHVTVFSTLMTDKPVIGKSFAGKWISPMHPEIIRDKPGKCPICGMALVPTEEYFSSMNTTNSPPSLVIPATAPLITGKRAVVYVAVPDIPGTYEGREIVLGPRAGKYYVVKSGLKAGEQIVVNGNFKIDSAMQLAAKPSMMNMEQHNHTEPVKEEIIDLKNKKCPVMGGDTIKDAFVIYEGKKIYFCCPGCDKTFLQDPEKYLKKLEVGR